MLQRLLVLPVVGAALMAVVLLAGCATDRAVGPGDPTTQKRQELPMRAALYMGDYSDLSSQP
jgi:outer membrane murein-binding lipoprotein Lpp